HDPHHPGLIKTHCKSPPAQLRQILIDPGDDPDFAAECRNRGAAIGKEIQRGQPHRCLPWVVDWQIQRVQHIRRVVFAAQAGGSELDIPMLRAATAQRAKVVWLCYWIEKTSEFSN